jgi:hypothetical protein
MKTILPAWAYALCLALAILLGMPSAAVAGAHKSSDCYSHRALTICSHNASWSKSVLKRTYAAKHKKKRWGHHRARHHAAHWRHHGKHHAKHMRHHGKHHAKHWRKHRGHHANRHHKRHAGHVDLVTRQMSIVVGPCETSLPKLPHAEGCVHGAIVYPPVVERVTGTVANSERGRTGRYYPRGYYDPNAWRYRPTDLQLIHAVHKTKGMKH